MMQPAPSDRPAPNPMIPTSGSTFELLCTAERITFTLNDSRPPSELVMNPNAYITDELGVTRMAPALDPKGRKGQPLQARQTTIVMSRSDRITLDRTYLFALFHVECSACDGDRRAWCRNWAHSSSWTISSGMISPSQATVVGMHLELDGLERQIADEAERTRALATTAHRGPIAIAPKAPARARGIP